MTKWLNTLVESANTFLWSYILIGLLILLGIYFTIKTNFVQFRYFREMFRLLSEQTDSKNNEEGISSFQAFCISAASRIGTGNMAGVALAIAIGGPGSVFWMWIIALIGSSSSFVESTLGQIYKVKDGDEFRGGPAYYIEKALNKRWLGIIFSILITISFGFVFNSVQSNTIASAFQQAFGIKTSITGLILVVLSGLIIFGGVKRIANVSSVIVPIMALIYVGLSIFIMIKNITLIPEMIKVIFTNAFGINQTIGGTLVGIMLQGIKRGLFSNEAGMGSVPNAAAAADTSHPVKQGLIQTLGVFTDTLLVCSATAFIILLSGIYKNPGNLTGIQLTQAAVSSQVGSWGNSFIAVSIFLFAFSSIIGNYYYGETNIEFIKSNKSILFIYRIIVLCMIMLGSIAELSTVWNMADLFMGLMAVINLVVIAKLGPIVYESLKDYTRQREEGKNPVFKASSIPGLKNVDFWKEEHKK
ncbi:alanine:cation symporter family protein [Anaerosalibacter bizertensis]|uniref:Alanine:cation symporter family protein n=1 Tax=Anaerosalibacter bizertensis TaxID=932217 RepID=A0A844FF73_9FIRM|nr:alanine/glycine:cation symporter family protein [Anaerosalibacter bizertensis]MSS42628.1 alanine:cation symporter family protein [Anaerosalibacter bizertensis]